MKVVITGASSPLGRALIDELLEHGCEILAICRKNSERKNKIPYAKEVNVVECDLCGLANFQTDATYDVFYHFAWVSTAGNEARDAVDAHVDNIKYTMDAVNLAYRLGCRRFVGAGSQAEFGRVNVPLNADLSTRPESAYGMAKLCAGQMSRLRCEQLGMEHIWTRILSVYGAYDSDKTLVMSVIKNLMKGNHVSCTNGEQIWDFLYSKDAAKALWLLGEHGKSGKTYVLGSGEGRSLREYIEIIRTIVNPIANIGYGEVPYSEKQVMYLKADIAELKKDTGFEVRFSFEEGVRDIKDIIWH